MIRANGFDGHDEIPPRKPDANVSRNLGGLKTVATRNRTTSGAVDLVSLTSRRAAYARAPKYQDSHHGDRRFRAIGVGSAVGQAQSGGREAMSYTSIQTDMKNAGAKWTDSEVVVDHGIITIRPPDDLAAFNAKITAAVLEDAHARSVA
jgi:hypothetical protein